MRQLSFVALTLPILIITLGISCQEEGGLLSGSRAGRQAAQAYCDCLANPTKHKVSENLAALQLFEKCNDATSEGMRLLMARTKRTPEQAADFSNEYHKSARQCEQKLPRSQP